MKIKKEILSIIIVLLLIINCMPITNAIEYNLLSINGNIYDNILDIEYGWKGTKYIFSDKTLNGIREGENVYLVADAETVGDLTVDSNISITLSNFRLEGTNAADYAITEYVKLSVISKDIKIVKKTIKIAPKHSYIYFGQNTPNNSEICEVADYSKQIINNENVNISAIFNIETGSHTEVGDYPISIKNGSLKVSGYNAYNYNVILDPDAKFSILSYNPPQTVVPDKEYIGVTQGTLKAPDGFLISNNNNNGWKESITVPLKETTEGLIKYYIRNNNSTDIEYFNAISDVKKYNYTCVQTIPKVKKITFEKDNNNSLLKFLSFDIISNENIIVTVYVEGGFIPLDTNIYLGNDDNYECSCVKAENAVINDEGRYTYTASFKYEVNKGESISKNLKAYAEYCSYTLKSEEQNKFLMIDKRDPVVVINNIDGNYDSDNDGKKDSIKVDFSVSDADSGIKTVKYKWDDGFKLNADDNKYQTDYKTFDNYSDNQTDYSIILPWNCAKPVENNRHEIEIVATDMAGNQSKDNRSDGIGSDILPPNIKSVSIKQNESENTRQNKNLDIKYLSTGTYCTSPAEIIIKADDNENLDFYYSGVKTVKIKYNDNYEISCNRNIGDEYIFEFPSDIILNNMSVVVEDGNGLATEKYITDISEHGEIKSNNLILDSKLPNVSFNNIEMKGHIDNQNRIWFGKNDSNVNMNITVNDKEGKVNSGIHTVFIKDNDINIYENSNFDINTFEFTKSIRIGNLSDGEHKFTVYVEDYRGNFKSSDITIFIDTQLPTHNLITVASPKYTIINGKQWFNKNDVIKFRVKSFDDASGLNKIKLNINDKVFIFGYQNIQKDETGYYVEVDTSGINTDAEQKYTISGTVTDFANNDAVFESLTVYKDFNNPIIRKLTVQNKNIDIVDKILKILSFGVYSNDTLILKAYTDDITEYDSGIDYAEVQYDGFKNAKKMTGEGNGVFLFEFPNNEKIFESNIVVKVYDKFGKASETCPNIVSEDQKEVSNSNYIMIETDRPSVSINTPSSDSVNTDDNRCWYKTNKEITVTAFDKDSGINNIDLWINGKEILNDKRGVPLLKSSITESADSPNNDENIYIFDTDYITSVCGENNDGKYEIVAKVTDNAGNAETKNVTYFIDKNAPSIDRINFIPKTVDGLNSTTEFIENLEYGYYFKTDFNVTVNVSDLLPSSGCYEVKYRLVPYTNGKSQEEFTGTEKIIDGVSTINIPNGFKGQIFVEAFDYVLNSSGEKTTKAYVVDKLPPDIKVIKTINTNYHDSNGNNLYVENNQFTVVITDNVSGISQIGYLKNAENNAYDRKIISVNNTKYNIKDDLGDGWIVTGTDENLVTQITKTFTFSEDDNDICMVFDATDNSLNKTENVMSERFSVDKTAPVINVAFRDNSGSGLYYNQNRIADITVIERNFNENLIKASIVNTFGNVPTFTFVEKSKSEHTAVINFDEGDYTFDLTGTDLGNHTAIVNFSGGNEKLFYVDKTKPVVKENFAEFSNSSENSFNTDKTAKLTITEHNFAPELVNLKIKRKDAGSQHNANGFEDVTSEVLGSAKWDNSGDVHTFALTFDFDAVYYVEIIPTDLAKNMAEKCNTVIFEIDKTKPIVSMKNGSFVGEDDTEFLDVYTYERKEDPAPTIEFYDLNISYIEYELSVYVPKYSNLGEVVVEPVITSGRVDGNKYTLPDFENDGIYAVKLTAFDIAGNQSEFNLNTYARMINQDVLAYIMDSSIENKTGLYSLEYEDGTAISKKPSSFEDLKIFVMAKKNTDIEIVLRDSNGKEIVTNAASTVDDSIYGIGLYNYLLKSEFFRDNFQNDTDIELNLTVKNQSERIDLAKMHIDNIAPNCDIPEVLSSWHWFYGDEDRTFTITNISEFVDENNCKIYDNGSNIPFVYSGNDNTIKFTLSKGWHNIGIVLEDAAGNTNNIQEIVNIYIGYFWLWIIIAFSVIIVATSISIIIGIKKRKKQESENF